MRKIVAIAWLLVYSFGVCLAIDSSAQNTAKVQEIKSRSILASVWSNGTQFFVAIGNRVYQLFTSKDGVITFIACVTAISFLEQGYRLCGFIRARGTQNVFPQTNDNKIPEKTQQLLLALIPEQSFQKQRALLVELLQQP